MIWFFFVLIVDICTIDRQACIDTSNTPKKYIFIKRGYLELEYGIGDGKKTFKIDTTVLERYKSVPGYLMVRLSFEAYMQVTELLLMYWCEFINAGLIIEQHEELNMEGARSSKE